MLHAARHEMSVCLSALSPDLITRFIIFTAVVFARIKDDTKMSLLLRQQSLLSLPCLPGCLLACLPACLPAYLLLQSVVRH
jgi:hypothetical protein